MRLALVVGVDTEAGEPANPVGEVELALELELLLLLGRRDAVDQLPRQVRVEHREVLEQLDVPVHADGRMRPCGEMQVRGLHVDGRLEEGVDRERGGSGLRELHGATYRQHGRTP